MASRDEVFEKILQGRGAAQDVVRRDYVRQLSEYTKRDVILYASAFTTRRSFGVPPGVLSVSLEDVHGFMSAAHGLTNKKLDLIIHSPGGSAEAAEQIVRYLRTKYDHIRAIIPQNAMSAATMLACACEEVVMGKHSALGPIDPQITLATEGGAFTAPAQSILDEVAQAKAEIAADQRTIPVWLPRLQRLPPGILKVCEDATKLSIDKVTTWLEKYMFAGDATANAKATAIAKWLGDSTQHRTHGRPLMADDLRSKGLVVSSLEADQQLQDLVLSVFHSIVATFNMTSCVKFVENQNGKGSFLVIDVAQQMMQPIQQIQIPIPQPPPG